MGPRPSRIFQYACIVPSVVQPPFARFWRSPEYVTHLPLHCCVDPASQPVIMNPEQMSYGLSSHLSAHCCHDMGPSVVSVCRTSFPNLSLPLGHPQNSNPYPMTPATQTDTTKALIKTLKCQAKHNSLSDSATVPTSKHIHFIIMHHGPIIIQPIGSPTNDTPSSKGISDTQTE